MATHEWHKLVNDTRQLDVAQCVSCAFRARGDDAQTIVKAHVASSRCGGTGTLQLTTTTHVGHEPTVAPRATQLDLLAAAVVAMVESLSKPTRTASDLRDAALAWLARPSRRDQGDTPPTAAAQAAA